MARKYRLRSWLVLAVLLVTLTCAAPATADWVITGEESYTYPDAVPSFTGEIIVEATGSLSLTGYDVTLPGGAKTYGHLMLNACILRFTPVEGGDIGFRVAGSGRVDATDTTITTTNGQPLFLATYRDSVNTFTRCELDPVHACITCNSHNTFTDCHFAGYPWTWLRWDSHNTFSGTTFDTLAVFMERSVNQATDCDFVSISSCGGWSIGSSQNTFENCSFNGFEFHSPSANTLQNCTFLTTPLDPRRGLLALFAEQDTTLDLDGLVPGYQPNTTIQSSTNAFGVQLTDCTIPLFSLATHGNAVVDLADCQLLELTCTDYTQTTFTNSQADVLLVYTTNWQHMGQGGVLCPYVGATVDLTVRGFHDGAPQTVDVTSDNSSFLLRFVGSSATSSCWSLGDCGGGTSSENLIEDSSMWLAVSRDNANVLVRNSTLEYGGVGGYSFDTQAAQFTAEDSRLVQLDLNGAAPRAVLRRSRVNGVVTFWGTHWLGYPEDPPAQAPTLVLENGLFDVGDPRVYVKRGVSNAHLKGSADIVPVWHVMEWGLGSTITRTYPVLVQDRSRAPLPDVPVHVYNALGNLVWQGVTSPTGTVQAEITFDDANYASEFRVKAWAEGGADSAPVYFLSSTPITLCPGAHPLSFTSFEEARHPWTTFAAGADTAVTWRQLAGAEVPRLGGLAPEAHSGDYEMLCDAAGEGITGLRLDLPVTPSWPEEVTLRAWLHPLTRSGAGASSFVGFTLDDAYPAVAGWGGLLGYEVISDAEGALQLGGSSLAAPGLTAGSWHVVAVSYDRVGHRLTVSLDGEQVADESVSSGLGAASHAVLGAWSSGTGEQQATCFDDVNVVLGTTPSDLPEHLYSGLSGPEKIVEARPVSLTLWYGNGYPVIGGAPTPGEQGVETMELRLALPEPMEFVSSTPAPNGYVGGDPVWQMTRPYLGQERYILLEAQVPTGVVSGAIGPVGVYRDSGLDPEDLLPQYVLSLANLRPDLYARKEGPETACPGDTVNYLLTVGNAGYATADTVVVRDLPPAAMGGGDRILANLASLAPGEVWRGALSLVLSPTTPTGAAVTNTLYTESLSEEISYLNNSGDWSTLVQDTPDPNQVNVVTVPGLALGLKAGPVGGVERGDLLAYTVDCDNPSEETAYGAYATMLLDPRLDDNTLSLPGGMSYDATTRMLLWEIGTLPPHGTDSATFYVQVPEFARRARSISMQATIYFPSLPLEKPTNVVVSVVNGSFPDVLWNHWAILPVEQARENGVVGGYPDGTYWPTLPVDRGQMAVFISRAVAGGDGLVKEEDPPLVPTFTDIPTDHWAYKYIEYAKAQNVVAGYPDGSYRAGLPLDRGQMAVFIARAIAGSDAAVPAGPGTPTFSDVTATNAWNWCYKHVEYAVGRGVVGGYPDGLYHPELGCTRDQMAVFVARAFELPM